jgi:type VI secretion system secreted protein VgrG
LALNFGVAQASSAPLLGAVQDFSVLAASTITNTGSTVLVGDLGLSPGTAVTGFGSFSLTGAVHVSDIIALDAHNSAVAAYTVLENKTSTINLSGQDLSELTLHPGIYHFDSSAQLSGTLTLDALNDPNAMFIFQIGSSLTTASSSAVNVINAGNGTGIFWQVGSSATLGTGTAFAGNILANQSITLQTGAGIFGGRALALNAAVTMDHNAIYNNCLSACNDFGSKGYSGVSAVPEPNTSLMLGFGLLLLLVAPKLRTRFSAGAKAKAL